MNEAGGYLPLAVPSTHLQIFKKTLSKYCGSYSFDQASNLSLARQQLTPAVQTVMRERSVSAVLLYCNRDGIYIESHWHYNFNFLLKS